jgi:DHA1 family inner membrane transport protein
MFFTRFIPKPIQYAYRWDARSAWLSGLYVGMTAPFFGVVARDDLGATDLEIFILTSAPFLGHLLSMLIAWHMQERAKKPYVVWLGILARALVLLLALAHSSRAFIGILIAAQIAGCFTAPAYASIMKDAYPDAYRGRLMGLVRVGMTVMTMLASITMGRLMDHGLPWIWVMAAAGIAGLTVAHELPKPGWRIAVVAGCLALGALAAPLLAAPGVVSYRQVFILGALLGILALWMFNHLPEGAVEVNPAKRFNLLEGLGTLFTDWRFGLYSLAFFIFGFGNLLQVPLIPMFQVDELHITKEWVGILAMITSGVSALFYFIWGRVMDRFSPFLAVSLSFAVWGFSPFVYAGAHTIPTLIIASVLVGIAAPGIDLTWLNAVMHFADRQDIPRYTALHTFLVGIRGLLAPFVGMAIFHGLHGNFRASFLVSAVVIWAGSLLMMAVVWFVIRPHRREMRVARASEPVV